MASSWVPDVDPASDFSLANIPFGIISTPDNPAPRVAVAIGSHALDLAALAAHSDILTTLFPDIPALADAVSQPTLNAFAALGRPVHRRVRAGLQDLLSATGSRAPLLRDDPGLRARALRPLREVATHLPMAVGDYTDFYAGYHHAHAVGTMFRGPHAALQPNYLHLPVGYHGRASSLVVSGKPVRRPVGQILLPGPEGAGEAGRPVTAPSRKLDFELELGCFVGRGNDIGRAVPVGEAEECIFGYVLLNDWSARDIQKWEYVPLGPFNGKNFATTVSPWVVLADALEPFRTWPIENPTELQDYLKEGREDSVFDIRLEVDLTTAEGDTTTIARTSSKHLIWSFPQMIAHHTVGGCPLRTGDLLGSGTISGPGGAGERGSLLEMTENGKKEVLLAGMDARMFLKDGDSVTLRGFCGPDGARVGFGECRGRIYSAVRR
ncbi:4f6d2aec-dc99-47a1-9b2a-1dd811b10846 [Thermothielavioides terrestris]|uniref:Fumarylacetoacetase n=1 Tax=Thermothielavioides terrestris TaxID=2587410 RepID=A0A3S5CXT9_9PEZI|nr:4f6d2aec-dc99-47a1-9b2a-1dd811b10846 [Thermothielavioides terrestris]